MGLSFLNKKTWHPGSFANIEKVWIAEQKQRENERKQIENMKKLKEERQIEELKKLQVEAGLIPSSHLQRLDWMYQGPDMTSNISTAEEFLLGKPLKDEKAEEKRHFTPVFQESYSNPQNEIFTKVHEDPMFVIKREENKARKDLEENPYKMKMLLKEIETKLNKEKKKDKKDKKKDKHKDKKDKKEKHKKRKRCHSRSSSKSSDSESDNQHKKHKKSKEHKRTEPTLTITTPSLLAAKSKNQTPSYGLIDKEGNKITSNTKSLGPDEKLFKDRKEFLNKEASFKQKTYSSSSSVRSLSEDEKEKLRKEMEYKAMMIDFEKQKIVDKKRDSSHNSHSHSSSSKPNFLKTIEKDIYTSGKRNLEDNVKKNKTKMKEY